MHTLRKFIRRILLAANILLLLVFIYICYAVPNVKPGNHWPLGLLGLAFPFLLLLVVAFIVFWFFVHFRYIFFGMLAIIICWPFVSALFAFHLSSGHQTAVSDSSLLRVMSYNVHYFKNLDSSGTFNAHLRGKMMDLIAEEKPDILCLQEFYTSENPNDFDNKKYISQTFNLPYRYFSSDHNYKNNHSGVILFSRFPVIHAEKVDLMGNNSKEIAIYADIRREKDTFRVFTAHLQSVYLSSKDLQDIDKIKQQQDSSLKASRNIVRKLKKAFSKRGIQTDALSEQIKKSPYPVILCGDFNDPPNSYTYFKIKDGLKDAFLEKGWGFGRTYSKISPTLRIDYIFTDPSIETVHFKIIHKNYSDHFPIVAELSLANHQ